MSTYVEIICPHCKNPAKKELREVNAAKKRKGQIFCSKKCAFDYRKTTPEQKKEVKKLYDKEYRQKNLEAIKVKKSLAFKKDYKENPEKYRAIRKAKQQKHNEYCRQPKYKEKKKSYDEQYRAKKNYGEFWESAILVKEIVNEYDNRVVKQSNNLINKSRKRKRLWQQMQTNLMRLT